MNDTIAIMLRHRSIRKFTSDKITSEQKDSILSAAQQASTSSNMQAYSVIGVTDGDLKKQLAKLAGNQVYIEESPWFLIWCADLYRYDKAVSRHSDEGFPSNMENFIVATVDTALAAQNAAIAAESLGLGIVYIGGIRNHPKEVSELLKLPKLVYPVFGMCIGVPDQQPIHRPRMPRAAVYHENAYSDENFEASIDDYDQITQDYMQARSGGKLSSSWSQNMAAKAQRAREHMREFLLEQGYELK
jgi:FMN reductase (NADPH)